MGQTRAQIQIIPKMSFPPQINMVMSRVMARKLSLPRYPIWVSFGSSVELAHVAFASTSNSILYIDSHLAHRLHIKSPLTLRVKYDVQRRQLQLGPLLGILINTQAPEIQGEDPFGPLTRFLEECSLSTRNRGVCLTVFSPEGLNLDAKKVTGFFFDKKKWNKSTFPLPNVIYNRITSRRVERNPNLQLKLQKLRKLHGVSIFNETFLDKQQVHQLLHQDEAVRHLLPETHPYRTSWIRPMLNRYGTVYIKPNKGSLGQGVIRLMKQKNLYTIQYTTATGTLTRTNQSLKEVIPFLKRRTARSSYLIQQGLNLARIGGRVVDFRVLVQRNGRGEWTITSTVGRIANDRNIVSNLARGGTLRKAAEVIRELEDIPNKPTASQLRRLTMNIVHSFDRKIQGHFAELGIDLALDQNGKFWLLEINSKPSKTDDAIANPTLLIRPSVRRLIDYTCYLTGMTVGEKSRSIHRKRREAPWRYRR